MSRLHKKNFRIPSVGKAGKGRESFPISFMTSIFQPYSFLGRMAEVTEHPTYYQKVPSSNPVWNQFFFSFLLTQSNIYHTFPINHYAQNAYNFICMKYNWLKSLIGRNCFNYQATSSVRAKAANDFANRTSRTKVMKNSLTRSKIMRIWKKSWKKILVRPGFEPRTPCVLVGHSTTELRKLKTNLAKNLS